MDHPKIKPGVTGLLCLGVFLFLLTGCYSVKTIPYSDLRKRDRIITIYHQPDTSSYIQLMPDKRIRCKAGEEELVILNQENLPVRSIPVADIFRLRVKRTWMSNYISAGCIGLLALSFFLDL